jgi:hypothetical protein
MPKRIQRKRTKGWKMPPNTVYVGRPSKWGNPYFIGGESYGGIIIKTTSIALEEYRRLFSRIPDLAVVAQQELRGKDLACWCKEGEECHADFLLKVANQ